MRTISAQFDSGLLVEKALSKMQNDRSSGANVPLDLETRALDQDVIYMAEEAGISFLGTGLGRGLRFLLNVVIAHLFGAEILGLYNVGIAIANIMTKVNAMGLGLGTVRFVSMYSKNQRIDDLYQIIVVGLLASLVISTISMGVFYLTAPAISTYIFISGGSTIFLRIVAVSMPFMSLVVILTFASIALGVMKYKVYVLDLTEPIVMLCVASALFHFLGPRLLGLGLAYIAWIAVATVLAFYSFSRLFSITECLKHIHCLSRRVLHDLLGFSIPMGLSDILNVVIQRLDILLLGFFVPSGDIGVYSAAAQISLLFSMLLQPFRTVYAPMVPALEVSGDVERLRHNLALVTRWIVIIGFPLVLLILILGSNVLSLFGPRFSRGNLSLIILTLGQMLNIGVGLSGVTLAMVGHSRLHLANNLLALTSSFGLGIVLIPGFGIVGAAATQAISRGVVNLLAVFELYFLLHIHPYERAIIKPIIAGILAALAVYPLKTMLVGANTLFSLMLLASVFGALYLMLLYFLKLAPQDYQALSLVGKMLWLSRPRWK